MKFKPLLILSRLLMYSIYGFVLQCIFCGFILASDPINAQVQSVKEVKISIAFSNDDLLTAFQKIENSTDYNFVYNYRDLDQGVRINEHYQDRSLYSVLLNISNQASLGFKQVNQNINVRKLQNLESHHRQARVDIIEEREVSGTVTSDTGEPVPGVNVLVQGTTIGTVTDTNGSFTLSVPDDAKTLVFSFIGYQTQEVEIGEQSVVEVVLQEDITALSEVVVVGYGTQERANVTGAIAQVKSESFENIPISSIEQGFASQLPGVEVVQSSGRPGQASQINIRGISTITAGTSPLIVLDGLPLSEGTSLNTISPNDIASVEVLKDAASAAIYGSRGANGVILITTKSGKTGKAKFSFNSYVGIQEAAHTLDLMNASEHAIWDRDARNNYYLQFDDGTFSITDDNATREANAAAFGFNSRKAIIPSYVQPYLNGQQGLTDTDWQDEVLREAKIENYQLSASGGTEATKYFVSGNYFRQEGIVVGSDFERFSFRSNLETKLNDKLTLGIKLSPSFIKENVVPTGFNNSPINGIVIALPYFPAYNPDGSLAISQQVNGATEGDQSRAENPVALALLRQDERINTQLQGGGFLEYEILKGLKAKTYFGVDMSYFRRQAFTPSEVGSRNRPAPQPASGTNASSDRVNWVAEQTIDYSKTFEGGHQVEVLAGYTYQQESFDFSEITATDFPNDFVSTLNAGVVNGGTSMSSEWSLISYLGRARYNYQGKYLFTAAVRRDGSSRFGANNRWGVFPSFSVGYRISEEPFFAFDNITDLKIRASWGVVGNNQIGDFGSQALLSQANAILNGGIQSGLAPATSPNSNLGWEETNTLDIGFDLGLFEDRLTIAFDYYKARTKDLLLLVPVPAHSGFSTSLQNIGRVENRGIEINLVGKYNLGPIQATSTFNFVSNTNEVLELGPGQEEIIVGGRNITRIGEELGASFGYRVQGIFTSQSEIDNTPSLSTAQVGEYIYADSNNDGVINADDRVILGSVHPDFTFGLTSNFQYKGFDLGFVLQGVQGAHVHDRTVSVLLYNPEGWNNGLKDYFNNYYTPERGESAVYARPNTIPRDNGFYRETDLLQEDASFVRIRNITLGYTIPNALIDKVGIESFRLYLSSKNPFTFTDYRGFNPEQRSGSILSPTTGFDNYPIERSIVVGVNVNF